MTRTVTLPLTWREDDEMLFVGPFEIGWVVERPDGWCAEGWWGKQPSFPCHLTRAAAMAALEEAVCKLGVKP